jgi:hypothetical protein
MIFVVTKRTVPTHADLAATKVNDRNFKTYLRKGAKGTTVAEYVAAKQLFYFHTQGDLIPIKLATRWYYSELRQGKKPKPKKKT